MSDEEKVEEKSGTDMMTISVKTPKEKQDIELITDATVKDFRELVSQKFDAPQEQLCLIFAGKILKDGDTMAQHGIKDGLTVHLVVKSANRPQQQAAERSASASPSPAAPPSVNPPANTADTPFGMGGLGGLAGLGNLGMGSANFMEMQQRMQREMMSNPEMVRNMMDNPFVQQLMSNPDVMRQMITSNPQMRELMERNPEITHMLNNPELMRQTMELARNPAMVQELMRSQDRAMSNLESIPGGFNALQRMYHDIQEPMMSAAQEGFGARNPFASLAGSDGANGDGQQGRENTDPLPNPWAPAGSPSTGSGTGSPAARTTTSTTTPSSSNTTAMPNMGIFQSPGMQSLMSQMQQNPQLTENMMQAPYMQAMMESMAANPELSQQIMSAHPMMQGNPQLQEQVRQYMPQMMQQMQNPEMQRFLTNPRAMEAMQQVQSGMSTLQDEAPGLFPGLMVPPRTTSSSSDPDSPAITTGNTTTADTTTTNTTGTTSTPITTGPNNDQMTNLMSHLMSMMSQGQANQPADQRYASQLDQLTAMGFVDREANIRALQASLGDVNGAIERLLQQR